MIKSLDVDGKKTHFKLGFDGTNGFLRPGHSFDQSFTVAVNQKFSGSNISLGNDKNDLRTVARMQYGYKQIKKSEVTKRLHKNAHSFSFGYTSVEKEEKKEIKSQVFTNHYKNFNKQTSIVLGDVRVLGC